MFTHATDRVDVYQSRPKFTSAGMPGPEGPAHRGWLGVVTGIRLIQISTGDFLVQMMHDSQYSKLLSRCLNVNTKAQFRNRRTFA